MSERLRSLSVERAVPRGNTAEVDDAGAVLGAITYVLRTRLAVGQVHRRRGIRTCPTGYTMASRSMLAMARPPAARRWREPVRQITRRAQPVLRNNRTLSRPVSTTLGRPRIPPFSANRQRRAGPHSMQVPGLLGRRARCQPADSAPPRAPPAPGLVPGSPPGGDTSWRVRGPHPRVPVPSRWTGADQPQRPLHAHPARRATLGQPRLMTNAGSSSSIEDASVSRAPVPRGKASRSSATSTTSRR
jgi:hypothetical protein